MKAVTSQTTFGSPLWRSIQTPIGLRKSTSTFSISYAVIFMVLQVLTLPLCCNSDSKRTIRVAPSITLLLPVIRSLVAPSALTPMVSPYSTNSVDHIVIVPPTPVEINSPGCG